MSPRHESAVWFPTVRTGTGTDVFTERLAAGLIKRGIRAEITWLPLRAEYAPWTVAIPQPPDWATVAHVNTWLHSRLLPKQLPVVATIHHSVHHPDLRPYKGAVRSTYHRYWIAPNERRVLRSVRRVVAVSQFVADTARRHLLNVPMEVIYNAVDIERFSPPAQRTSHQPFRLLYAGTWTVRKGVDLLTPIMRELGANFELLYTGGEAAYRDKNNMAPNMRDVGRLREESTMISAMRDADALLFPSRSEGLPLVVIEAMACGLPVIATRGSSLTEVVEGGVTGTLCPQDDVVAFAESARNLAANPALVDAMSIASRRVCVQRFSATTMIDAYLEIYRHLD